MRRGVLRRQGGIASILAAVLGLGLAAVPAPGRAQDPAPPRDERLARIFSDVTEVNVVNVEVVVTDAEGRPVTDLTAADFELLEDGRPVEISNFYAVAGGQPVPLTAEPLEEETGAAEEVAPPPALHLAVFVDDVHLSPANRARALARLREHLERSWRPGLQVMLASNERAVTLRQTFTEDREALFAALDEVERAGSRSLRFDRDLDSILGLIERVDVDSANPSLGTKTGIADRSPEEMTARVASEARSLVPQITAYAQGRAEELRFTLRVLGQLVDAVAGLPGRKAVIYVSDGLSANPAEALFEIYDRRFASLGPVAAEVSLASEADRFDLTRDFQGLTAAANAGGVTLYTIDASPPAAVRRGGADQGSNFAGSGFASIEDRNEQESLVMMAEETGGRASLVPSAMDAALEGFFTDLDNYYSLGYTAERRGRERVIEVRLKDRGKLRVRHRRAVRDRTTDERLAERTLSALVLESSENPLGIALETGEPQPAEEGNFRVPVIVKIPLGGLVLVPGVEEHLARVTMYVAALDEQGRTSQVIKQLCPIRIPNSELLVALGREAGCGMRLLMRPGGQRVAVSVHDELASKASTAELHLDVGAAPAGETAPATEGLR